jgi:hypothetical protein
MDMVVVVVVNNKKYRGGRGGVLLLTSAAVAVTGFGSTMSMSTITIFERIDKGKNKEKRKHKGI